MATPAKVPDCYGNLYDSAVEACQACLLNTDCKKAQSKPRAAEDTDVQIPDDKKSLILAVCKKFGIPTSYYSNRAKVTYEVTEENKEEFFNLDLLITSKPALEKLLRAKLEEE